MSYFAWYFLLSISAFLLLIWLVCKNQIGKKREILRQLGKKLKPMRKLNDAEWLILRHGFLASSAERFSACPEDVEVFYISGEYSEERQQNSEIVKRYIDDLEIYIYDLAIPYLQEGRNEAEIIFINGVSILLSLNNRFSLASDFNYSNDELSDEYSNIEILATRKESAKEQVFLNHSRNSAFYIVAWFIFAFGVVLFAVTQRKYFDSLLFSLIIPSALIVFGLAILFFKRQPALKVYQISGRLCTGKDGNSFTINGLPLVYPTHWLSKIKESLGNIVILEACATDLKVVRHKDNLFTLSLEKELIKTKMPYISSMVWLSLFMVSIILALFININPTDLLKTSQSLLLPDIKIFNNPNDFIAKARAGQTVILNGEGICWLGGETNDAHSGCSRLLWGTEFPLKIEKNKFSYQVKRLYKSVHEGYQKDGHIIDPDLWVIAVNDLCFEEYKCASFKRMMLNIAKRHIKGFDGKKDWNWLVQKAREKQLPEQWDVKYVDHKARTFYAKQNYVVHRISAYDQISLYLDESLEGFFNQQQLDFEKSVINSSANGIILGDSDSALNRQEKCDPFLNARDNNANGNKNYNQCASFIGYSVGNKNISNNLYKQQYAPSVIEDALNKKIPFKIKVKVIKIEALSGKPKLVTLSMEPQKDQMDLLIKVIRGGFIALLTLVFGFGLIYSLYCEKKIYQNFHLV